MHLADRYTVVFNGEIYNHLDLRRQFALTCTSTSDTETLLHLYAQLGGDCLKHIDGMFAFAIYDRQTRQLFAARDRAGKKPFYYYLKDGSLVFSSELNALAAVVKPPIDETAINQMLRLGFCPVPTTPYQHVYELPPGSTLQYQAGSAAPQVAAWWRMYEQYQQPSPGSASEALEMLDSALHTAVKRRIDASDLEVGSFLSGGIDSGIVTAIAAGYKPSLKTFTVSFDGAYDEAPLAATVASRYGTGHHEIRINFDDLQQDIEKILFNYGEPFADSSAIPSYYVSREARRHLTVILNGDGGDELLGGYRRYVPFAAYNFFETGPVVATAARVLKKLLPVSHDKQHKYNYLLRLVQLASKSNLNTYLSATLDIFEDYENAFLIWPTLPELTKQLQAMRNSSLSGLQQLMLMDFNTILPGDLLVKMDIATMAHSLEGRSPFLAKEMLELAPRLPDAMKVNGRTTKSALRQLAGRYLPQPLLHQPKRGFEIPLKKWVDTQLKEPIADCLLAPNSYASQFVHASFVQALWNRQLTIGDEKRAKMLWCLYSLEVWKKNTSQLYA